MTPQRSATERRLWAEFNAADQTRARVFTRFWAALQLSREQVSREHVAHLLLVSEEFTGALNAYHDAFERWSRHVLKGNVPEGAGALVQQIRPRTPSPGKSGGIVNPGHKPRTRGRVNES